MKIFFYFFIFCTIFCQNGYSQEKDYDDRKTLFKIAAHTDSSLFVIGKKAYAKGLYDLYISKHTAYKKTIDFDTTLYFYKLFFDSFNPDNFRYKIFQCDNNMVIVFDAIVGNNKTVIARTIDYNGNVSEAAILDEADITGPNYLDFKYFYSLTAKKEILITLRRIYKSGYQRDKCILVNSHLKKLWEYELPKINAHSEVNIIANVYNSNQLVYNVTQGNVYIRGTDWTLKNNTDTIIKKEVDGLNYDLKIRKDSLTLLVAFPLKNEVKILNVYWPFLNFPIITAVSSSQFIFYSLVNIDDEKFILPGKKAIYYKRIDIKNNNELFEKLIPFDRKTQDNLTYYSGANGNGPTFKSFGLVSERMIDGKLFSLFKHLGFDDSELIISSFSIADNKFEWINLLPRRLSTNAFLNDLTFSYSKKHLNLGYYENKDNFDTPLNLYWHKKYKIARDHEGSNFIQMSIDEFGNIVKSVVDESSETFLFPWLNVHSDNNDHHFFESANFLPIRFLYKFQ